MKSLTTALSLAALLGVAACAGNTTRPTDTGNMAYPTPQPQGQIGTTSPVVGTGSMSTPSTGQGYLAPSPGYPDTGNMALPRRAQGNAPVSR